MKTIFPLLLGVVSTLSFPASAQVAAPDAGVGAAGSAFVAGRGPHERTWARLAYTTNRQGQVTVVTNTAYVELSTGLHYPDPLTGTWLESEARFELTADGHAVARHGQHQVILAPNINSAAPVDLQMPDGHRMTSRPVGLAFRDTASGSNVLISILKDCAGQVIAPNVVLYPSAFDSLKAALRYTYTREGFEQDAVLYENPGSPANYGLDPATTVLEIWTEVLTAPTPRVGIVSASADAEDQQIEFGAMVLGQGQAYFLSLANHDEPSLPVRKSWQQIGGRTFLVESVPYVTSASLLERLVAVPQSHSSQFAHHVTGSREALVAQFGKPSPAESKLVARITPGQMSQQMSLVLDYTTLNSSQTNYTFKGDTTYYVSGTVNLYNTTTLEGGTVIKYTNAASGKVSLSGPLVCLTEAYRPAVLTSKDDNTVGDSITGSTGNPSNTNGGTYLYSSVSNPSNDLRYLRLSYGGTALAFDGLTNGVWHCQFVKCQNGIDSYNKKEVRLHNVLMAGSSNCIVNSTNIRGEHLTVDVCSNLVSATGASLALTNSLLTAVVSVGAGSPTYDHVVTASSGSGIYQVVGAASYYLADSSTNRNAGTTNLSASLLTDLNQRTTYPPLEYTNNFTTDTTLSPQAQRDTDLPDLGYHYDPLDYVVSARTLTNATLTLTNGVALATFGPSSSYGIYIRKGGNLVSEGTPTHLDWIVRYNTVQEQTTTNWSAATVAACVKVSNDYSSPTPQGSFRFTAWSLLGGKGYHFYANYPRTHLINS